MNLATSITTAGQLLEAGDIGPCELVRRKLILMSPAGANHGRIASRLDYRLRRHAEDRNLGEVFGAETGFVIARNPDSVRAPDVAFVVAARAADIPARGFFPGPPDLAVEVRLPDDGAGAVSAKVRDWLEAGTVTVWVVDPRQRTVAVHRRSEPVRTLGESDELSEDDLLPGLRLAVADMFGS